MTMRNILFGIFNKAPKMDPWIPDYLHPKYTRRSDAVEMLFCKKFAALPCAQTAEYIDCIKFIGKEDWHEYMGTLLLGTEMIQQLQERVRDYLTVLVEPRALYILMLVSDRIAIAVMCLTYIQYWAKQHNEPHITFHILTTRIFPNGFPEPAALKSTWYAQKVGHDVGGSDNLLDYKAAYGSILF